MTCVDPFNSAGSLEIASSWWLHFFEQGQLKGIFDWLLPEEGSSWFQDQSNILVSISLSIIIGLIKRAPS